MRLVKEPLMTNPDFESRMALLEAEVAEIREKLDEVEMMAGIERGLDEANRGLGRPAIEVVQELRAKYKLPTT
jgi:predicted transcriptional regulator